MDETAPLLEHYTSNAHVLQDMSQLPLDVLELVLRRLDVVSFVHFSQVSKRYANLVHKIGDCFCVGFPGSSAVTKTMTTSSKSDKPSARNSFHHLLSFYKKKTMQTLNLPPPPSVPFSKEVCVAFVYFIMLICGAFFALYFDLKNVILYVSIFIPAIFLPIIVGLVFHVRSYYNSVRWEKVKVKVTGDGYICFIGTKRKVGWFFRLF